ncbi:hypothetical protein D1007_35294 [Hordeum vulgare]|nr:hypothetical protein D1007_35294 [Hordeum vulgare]
MLALSAAGDVAIPELEMMDVKEEVMEEHLIAAFHPGLVGQRWSWSCMAMDTAGSWCPTSRRSPEREPSPRGRWCKCLPPSHLWTTPPYIDLTGDEDDNGEA